ncbi:MAG: zinc-ribbon domain-containing protein [Actinobacteria bacterium]|nr:zinc-ribbon domain-containing protein [Actinomycetota bacterium]
MSNGTGSCPRCGITIGTDAKFCSQCGSPVGEPPSHHEHDRDRLSWWERRPGWEKALILVLIAAVIIAIIYFVFQG